MKKILIILFTSISFFVTGQVVEEEKKEILNNKTTGKYYNYLSFDFNFGASGEFYYQGGVGFRYSLGYKMNPKINIGAGLGFEFYDFEFPTVFMPLYIEAKGELTNWRITPYYNVALGHAFKAGNRFENWDNIPNGVYFKPSIGWKFKRNEYFASTVSFGYQLQHAFFKRDDSWGEHISITKEKRIYQRYVIQFGFEF